MLLSVYYTSEPVEKERRLWKIVDKKWRSVAVICRIMIYCHHKYNRDQNSICRQKSCRREVS